MYFYWFREIAGWGLVVIALFMMRVALDFALNIESPQVVEASIVVIGSTAVLRAGIALIRVSTAARICRLEDAAKTTLDKPIQ